LKGANRRQDFEDYAFAVESLRLSIDITNDVECAVRATSIMHRLSGANSAADLYLDGIDLELISIRVNDCLVPKHEWCPLEEGLLLRGLPARFVLQIDNKALISRASESDGLHWEGSAVIADCEPQGFRRITFFPDRPDVKCIYDVLITADAQKFSSLLSNGELLATEMVVPGRLQVHWHDPIPKSSYSFALIASRLCAVTDSYTTQSGLRVTLHAYHSPEDPSDYRPSLDILKTAMRWDETHFGREYDSDQFSVVVLPRYSKGAMEYKSLNVYAAPVFKSAGPDVTVEARVMAESTIAHEYFHNAIGNRVGPRDWFNLVVKEGFVVFKHQEFSATRIGLALRRIMDVRFLREYQFPEDDVPSPLAPRPDVYDTLGSLYSRSVYEKGAELVRMLKTIVGDDAFRRGSDLFHQRFDLKVAQVEDFLQAFQDTSCIDLKQFSLWYTRGGRPRVTVDATYDSIARIYCVTFTQTLNALGTNPQPFHIPIRIAMFWADGSPMTTRLVGESGSPLHSRLVELRDWSTTYQFSDVAARPLLSALRNCSAPIDIDNPLAEGDLATLALHEDDAYSRWDACQRLFVKTVLSASRAPEASKEVPEILLAILKHLIATAAEQREMAAMQLRLPSERSIDPGTTALDIDGIHNARTALESTIGRDLLESMLQLYERMRGESQLSNGSENFQTILLADECLNYLVASGSTTGEALCLDQAARGKSVSECLGAVKALLRHGHREGPRIARDMCDQWAASPSMIEALGRIQAAAEHEGAAANLALFVKGVHFNVDDPGIVRAVFDHFIRNQIGLNAASGDGYRLLGDLLVSLIRRASPLVTRFLYGFDGIKRVDAHRRQLISEQLVRLLSLPGAPPFLLTNIESLMG
jgi:aminopeptidase N